MGCRASVMLFVVSVFLGCMLYARIGRALEGETASLPELELGVPDSLFIQLDSDAKERLLAEWRWKVGPEAEVQSVTVFGDIFTRTPNGAIYMLDTGWGTYRKVADDMAGWRKSSKNHYVDWFHAGLYTELQARGVTLEDGYVFSWIILPMVGGQESVDNIEFALAVAHSVWAAQVARVREDLGSEASNDEVTSELLRRRREARDEEHGSSAIFSVVINEEGQYSVWPVGETVPEGWQEVGKTCSWDECMDYIEAVWTDMRPMSLREESGG